MPRGDWHSAAIGSHSDGRAGASPLLMIIAPIGYGVPAWRLGPAVPSLCRTPLSSLETQIGDDHEVECAALAPQRNVQGHPYRRKRTERHLPHRPSAGPPARHSGPDRPSPLLPPVFSPAARMGSLDAAGDRRPAAIPADTVDPPTDVEHRKSRAHWARHLQQLLLSASDSVKARPIKFGVEVRLTSEGASCAAVSPPPIRLGLPSPARSPGHDTETDQHGNGIIGDPKGRIAHRSDELWAVPKNLMTTPPGSDRLVSLTLVTCVLLVYVREVYDSHLTVFDDAHLRTSGVDDDSPATDGGQGRAVSQIVVE